MLIQAPAGDLVLVIITLILKLQNMQFRIFSLAALLMITASSGFAQPQKKPGQLPKQQGQPIPLATGGEIEKLMISKSSFDFKSKSGKVRIGYERGKQPKDNVRPIPKETNEAMCLSKEEIRGQKIENMQTIIDASKATQILPGAVIDGEMLLRSGEFQYVKMNKRQPISVSLATNQGRDFKTTVEKKEGNNLEDDLRSAVNKLKSPSNIKNMPNVNSNSEVIVSTLEENTGLKLGASFFYMGVKASNTLKFSSSSFKYMYVYQFEQECLSVIANTVSSPSELFTDGTGKDDNLLYIREVKYGRRLYVIVEAEQQLESYSDRLKGSLNWAVVSAELNQNISHSSKSSQINIRVNTQGGSPIGSYTMNNIQQVIDNYFKKPYREIDIVPIAYKMTYMDGEPVSLVSDAFLDSKNCLDKTKVKIRLASIKCVKAQNPNKNEEVYGGVNIFYINPSGTQVGVDARTPIPPVADFPSGQFLFGSKDNPVSLRTGGEKGYGENEQGKYVAFLLPDLDMKIDVRPFLNEKDNVFNADDKFMTENIMRKTIRQLLLENTMSFSFEFRKKEAVIKLFFEILPE